MEHSEDLDPRIVLNSIYNGIIGIDSEGKITYFNKTAERIFNIPVHEALNRFILDVLPNTGGKLLESLNTGTPFYGEKLRGEQVTLVSNINPVITGGKISGVVSVFQDISEIENISKELDLFKNMKNWLDAIIDSSYDGVWICDREGKVIRINKASERIGDMNAGDVVGRNVRDLVAEGLFDKSVTLEVLKRRTSVTMIQRIKGEKTVLVTGNPIFDENGDVNFVMTNERDISELENLRIQLQESQALAKGYFSKLSELELKGVDLSSIIVRSEEMQKIIKMALKLAQVDSTVLLLGESGVGKGMIAKVIHKHSERSKGPFIRVDCAGIPDSLIESELFGYEKGAFTGAKVEGKPGFFEIANGGTLFLDEIAELPLGSQSKVLRFLEDHEIIRVGGTETREIDVRVIAATNKNIEDMVSSKRFRKDLYYRINVIPLYIRPLRERRDDIPPLLFRFLKKFNNDYQKKRVLSPEVVEALCRYNFPGNIRELANLVERLVVVAEKSRIELGDLPDSIRWDVSKPVSDLLLGDGSSLKEAVEEYEKALIERSMKKYANQRKVAKMLKVDQATISRKIRKYCIGTSDVFLHKSM